jgi:serine/threonine protein kinase
MTMSEDGQEVAAAVEHGVQRKLEPLMPTKARQARFRWTKWRRDISKHFSEKNSNLEWVQMERYFSVRWVSSPLIILSLIYAEQHVLDGNPLGHFAVKKIAVGQSHSYLLKILREVRLLERLHHPNIITYQYVLSFAEEVAANHCLQAMRG